MKLGTYSDINLGYKHTTQRRPAEIPSFLVQVGKSLILHLDRKRLSYVL